MGTNIKITKTLERYIENLSYALSPVQKEIISYNNKLGNIKKMQIAVSQCHFLELIIKIKNIKKVLEVGTFTGLSTLSMALALPRDGRILSLDKNRLTNKKALEFFVKAKQEKKIKTIINSALNTIRDLKKNNKKFDLIFIDADKKNYKKYYDYAVELTLKNDLIIIDNVLWHGEVADKSNNYQFTSIIRDFNKLIKGDNRVIKNIIPIGDGLTICIKK